MAPPRTRARRLALAVGAALFGLAVAAAPAGASAISPEPAHSPNAEDITTLYWIGLIAAAVLIVAINGSLVYVLRRYRSERGAEPRRLLGGRGIQLRAGGAIAALMTALFVLSVIFTSSATEKAPTLADGLTGEQGKPEVVRIEATGQQWLWRYQYPNGAFSYYRLVVPVDTLVELDLDSTDVVHSWYVPQLGGKYDAVPGRINHAWFRADETGEYEGQSTVFSGSAYAAMRTAVRVVTPSEYLSFIEQQKQDIDEAQQQAEQQLLERSGAAGEEGAA